MTGNSLTGPAIETIIADMAAQGITRLELDLPNGEQLRLSRDPDARTGQRGPEAAAPAAAPPAACFVTSPGVGEVLLGHPGAAEPLAEHGMEVEADAIVALLRIGLILRPVSLAVAGRLGAALAAAGTAVGYGTRIFELEPAAAGPSPQAPTGAAGAVRAAPPSA